MTSRLAVVVGERIARYGFGEGHPFGPDRHGAFLREFESRGFHKRAQILEPRLATDEELLSFHTPAHINLVRERSATGQGMLVSRTPANPFVAELWVDFDLGSNSNASSFVLKSGTGGGQWGMGNVFLVVRDYSAQLPSVSSFEHSRKGKTGARKRRILERKRATKGNACCQRDANHRRDG